MRAHPRGGGAIVIRLGLLIGLLLVLIAECIGRGLFYGLHMTVGLAVAG